MSQPFNGILCSPHSFYDEGIDFMLDLIQQTAATNTVVTYAYQGMTPGARPRGVLADHGKPIDHDRRDDATIWVNIDESYFRDTTLRHQSNRPGATHAGNDIYADLENPLADRGMDLVARVLEGWSFGYRPGFFNVHEIDALGRVLDHPCYNQPDYQRFWIASIHNLFGQYHHLKGLYYGSERNTPLTALLQGRMAGCFCPHCQALAAAQSLDPERARAGFIALHRLVQEILANGVPSDGAFVSIMRVLIEYPEILGWERLWRQSYNRLPALLRGVMKSIHPQLEIGWHGDNGTTGVQLFKRIATDYGAMTDTYDWIKPCVYHLATAPRMKQNLAKIQRTLFADLDIEGALHLQYAILGYDADVEPSFAELADEAWEKGRLSADWTRREMTRAVSAVAGRAKIYGGIGVGIPVGSPSPEDPAITYEDCVSCFEAGAVGMLAGREYDEIPIENLEAIGRAYREWVGV